jgi:hypothetical protein
LNLPTKPSEYYIFILAGNANWKVVCFESLIKKLIILLKKLVWTQ